MNGQFGGGQQIDRAERDKLQLFIRSVDFNATDFDVRNSHPCFQNAVNIKLVNDRETGRPRGFGYVLYETEEQAEQAFQAQEADTIEVNGREIIVDMCGDKAQKRRPGQGFQGGRGGGGGFRGGNRGGGFRGGRGGGFRGGFQQQGFQQGGYGGQPQFGGQPGGQFNQGQPMGHFSQGDFPPPQQYQQRF